MKEQHTGVSTFTSPQGKACKRAYTFPTQANIE